MKTSEIRDKLLTEKALYQQSVKNSDEAIKKITATISSISDDDVALLQRVGIDIRRIHTFDLERMKQDKEYLESCDSYLSEVINEIHSYLESELNV